MVKPIKSILVDVDAMASAQPALDRAAGLARAAGARLRIVDVQSDLTGAQGSLRAGEEDELTNRRREQLDRFADGVRDVPVETELLAGPPADALIHDVLRFGHNLVVRSRARDLVETQAALFGNVDAHLLRHCPCPVWSIGHGVCPQNPRIVAAVDASIEDPLKEQLNAKVVEWSVGLATLLKGTATLLQAWRPFSEKSVRYHGTSDEFTAYVDRARKRAEHDLACLGRPHESSVGSVHLALRRGEAEAVIPGFVVAEGVDLVVVGTTGRRGFARRLWGSTTERLIRKVPCSILIVKPDGFVSSVRLSHPA